MSALRSNKCSVGDREEQRQSTILHQEQNGVPLLVSEKFLRSMGMGQIDMATVRPASVLIWEVKIDQEFLSPRQWSRLKLSQDYLSKLFKRPAILKLISPDQKTQS
jgi:hypothetical protein